MFMAERGVKDFVIVNQLCILRICCTGIVLKYNEDRRGIPTRIEIYRERAYTTATIASVAIPHMLSWFRAIAM